MKAPVRVPVGGRQVRVVYVEVIFDEKGGLLCGEAYPDRALIRICKHAHKDARAVFRTLYHELCHISLGITGHNQGLQENQEEPIVYGLENMMADLFVFSPKAGIKYREVEFPFEAA